MIGLLAMVACDGYGLVVLGSAGVSTVGNATWTAAAESRTRLIAEDGEGVRVRGEWQDAGAGVVSVAVLGLRADTEYSIHIEAESGSPGEAIPFTTGPLPAAFPSWSTTGAPGWSGFLVTSLMGESQWAVVLDEEGAPVWFVEVPADGRLVRVRERKDGRGVWAVPAARTDKSDPSYLIGLDWNGVELERHEIAEFSHDYLELETGTIAFLNYDRREVEGAAVIGNTITELDLESGAEVDIFSTFDLWDPELDTIPGDGEWTGGNAMDFDDESGVYTAGFRQMGALVEVERSTGAVLRQFGGPSSDYKFADEGDELLLQHQFQWSGDSALVFDNRSSSEDSRVIEYAISDGMATPVWTHISDPPVWVFALGDVDRADDGSTFIDWASAGALEEVDAEGATRWTLSAELGTAFGFLDRVAGFGGFARP
ncbi:hypothetical protein LBMAG42_22350 [Deltaproteobacteria bacterium]|nr:hypothetical protein LBMAG42_22350 [Deltaproteobacteria bacterium]